MIRQTLKTFKSQYTIKEKQAKIKQICIGLIEAFATVCAKYNLKWWVDGGTLLGAVREGKIIDWDDDVDIVMLRDDYTKLVELCEKNPYTFGTNYFFQTAMTDAYLETFAKLRDNTTTALTPREYSMSHNRGMFIDIFPLDSAPQYLQVREDVGGFVRTVTKHTGQDRVLSERKRAWKMLNHVLQQVDEINEQSEYLMNASFLRYTNDCVLLKKSWYEKTVMMTLESISVPVPHQMEQVLNAWYENWQTPTQNTFHGYIDPFNSYRRYDGLSKDEFEYLIK